MPPQNRFILDRPTGRTLRARDALVCVFVAVRCCWSSQGSSIRASGEKMEPGVQRDIVLAVGGPGGWVADRFGVDDDVKRLTASLSPDETLSTPAASTTRPRPASRSPPTAASRPSRPTPSTRRRSARSRRCCRSSRSCSSPATRCRSRWTSSSRGGWPATACEVVREPHLGTGISKSDLLDWGRLSTQQVPRRKPEAIVFFLGANEGFPFEVGGKSVDCCGPAWAAQYATRARQMMETYRRERRRAPVLAAAAGPARPAAPEDRARRSTPRSSPPRRRTARTCACWTWPRRSRRAAATARRWPSTAATRSSASPTASTSTTAGAGLAAEIVLDRLKADFASAEE